MGREHRLPILDGKAYTGAPLRERAARMRGRLRERLGVTVRDCDDVSADAPPLKARVYRNLWIVECPDCKSAEMVDTDHPLFFCSNCLNGALDGRWRRVEFPAAKQRAQIEGVLALRPNPDTRNWAPGESVAALKRENREHGHPAEEVE